MVDKHGKGSQFAGFTQRVNVGFSRENDGTAGRHEVQLVTAVYRTSSAR